MHPGLRLNGIRRNFRPETGHLIRAEPFNRRIHRDVIVYIFCSLAYKLTHRRCSRIYQLGSKIKRAR